MRRGASCVQRKWRPGRIPGRIRVACRIVVVILMEGGTTMYGGCFGNYTQWAVVFLIIFVLFFLLVPGYTG